MISAAELRADHADAHAARATALDAKIAELTRAIADARGAAAAANAEADDALAAELQRRTIETRRAALARLSSAIGTFMPEPSRAGAAKVAAVVRELDAEFAHALGHGLPVRVITLATASVLAAKVPGVITWLGRCEPTASLSGGSHRNIVDVEGFVQRDVAADDMRALVESLQDLSDAVRVTAGSTAAPSDRDRALFDARSEGDAAELSRLLAVEAEERREAERQLLAEAAKQQRAADHAAGLHPVDALGFPTGPLLSRTISSGQAEPAPWDPFNASEAF